MKSVFVAAIIPALNEESTIADVIRTIVACELVDEVIVVSDGSTDATCERAQTVGARVFALDKTRGKGEAMIFAVAQTQANILIFFDADLIGLTCEHIEILLQPILSGIRSMNIGIRDRGRFFTWLSRHLPLISGERAMERRVFEGVPANFLHGFMVEASLNYYCRTHGFSYGAVELPNLTIRRKYQKVPWALAVIQYVRMSWEVVFAMVLVRMVWRGKERMRN